MRVLYWLVCGNTWKFDVLFIQFTYRMGFNLFGFFQIPDFLNYFHRLQLIVILLLAIHSDLFLFQILQDRGIFVLLTMELKTVVLVVRMTTANREISEFPTSGPFSDLVVDAGIKVGG